MTVIEQRSEEPQVSYEKTYGFPPNDVYYSFACSSDGIVDPTELNPIAEENFRLCESGQKTIKGKTLQFLCVQIIKF